MPHSYVEREELLAASIEGLVVEVGKLLCGGMSISAILGTVAAHTSNSLKVCEKVSVGNGQRAVGSQFSAEHRFHSEQIRTSHFCGVDFCLEFVRIYDIVLTL